MRWPNRKPHRLTPGMHEAQHALSRFLPLIDWLRFARKPVDVRAIGAQGVLAFGCADSAQAVLYMLRRDALTRDGKVDRTAPPRAVTLSVPGLADGRYRITPFDTLLGAALTPLEATARNGALGFLSPPFTGDLALAVRHCT